MFLSILNAHTLSWNNINILIGFSILYLIISYIKLSQNYFWSYQYFENYCYLSKTYCMDIDKYMKATLSGSY